MVTVAFWLQCALIFALLVLVGVAVAEAIRYDGLVDQAALGTNPDPEDLLFERTTNVEGALFTTLPLMVLAIWLGLTAAWVRRGSNVARILTWVGLGAPVLLSGLFCIVGGVFGVLLFAALGAAPEDDFDSGEEFPDGGFSSLDSSDFYDRLANLDSGGWSVAFGAIGTTFAAIALLLALAVGVLLLTGTANRYFRPEGAKPRRPQNPFWYAGQPVPGGHPHPVQAPPWPAAPPSPYAPMAPTPHPAAPYPPGAAPLASGPYPSGGASFASGPYPSGGVPFASGPYPSGGAPVPSGPNPSTDAPVPSGPFPSGAESFASGSSPSEGAPFASGPYPSVAAPVPPGPYPSGSAPFASPGPYPSAGPPFPAMPYPSGAEPGQSPPHPAGPTPDSATQNQPGTPPSAGDPPSAGPPD